MLLLIGLVLIIMFFVFGLLDIVDIFCLINCYLNGDGRVVLQFFDFDGGCFVCCIYCIVVVMFFVGVKDGDYIEWIGMDWVFKYYMVYDIECVMRL